MEKIKLVIWDLDETFWKGTLSEEGIEPIEKNIQLVKELTDRGIINSIISKNDFEQAKEKLIILGIWDYFCFPAIAWEPKGMLIQQIIEQCQLRDVNVLYLDDNHLNLEEAKFYNPHLHTRFPDFIDEINSHAAFIGKNDKEHTRLKQYKLLESKDIVKKNFSSNIEFLISSNIKIEFITNLKDNKERIVELLERTNQLNFTKIRSSDEEVEKLINDPAFSSAIISVNDNFGDYGFVGFYSLDIENKKLHHFVFSCRILNLGVSQYVYAKLGFPDLDIVPEVVEKLDYSKPHWIEEITSDTPGKGVVQQSNKEKTKIFFKGGCDLDQMLFYLQGNNFSIEEETNYMSRKNFSVHSEHTQVLLDGLKMSQEDKKFIEDSEYIPFVDEKFYKSNVFKHDYNCLVYSILIDYVQDIYEHKEKKIVLPYTGDLTNEEAHPQLIKTYRRAGIIGVDDQMLKTFSKNFARTSPIIPEKFIHNLKQIRENIPAGIPIIFINGAEIEMDTALGKEEFNRHKLMNAALDTFIANHKNVFLLDVRKIATKKSQITDSIRHYDRETYKNMSIELLKILHSAIDSNIKMTLQAQKISLSKNIHEKVRKQIHRLFPSGSYGLYIIKKIYAKFKYLKTLLNPG